MAKMISIIRYKFKADRDFESVQFEGMSCSLGELKRMILDKSSRTGTHHPKDDYDVTIKDATTDKGRSLFSLHHFYVKSFCFLFVHL